MALFRAIGDTEGAYTSEYVETIKCVEAIKQDKHKLHTNPSLNTNEKFSYLFISIEAANFLCYNGLPKPEKTKLTSGSSYFFCMIIMKKEKTLVWVRTYYRPIFRMPRGLFLSKKAQRLLRPASVSIVTTRSTQNVTFSAVS